MADDQNPENNQENLSEEEKLRIKINELLEELNEALKEQGVSDEVRESRIKAYKDLLQSVAGNAERLQSVQNSINGELQASTSYSRDFSGEIEQVVSRLNEVIESITNQNDLSNRILGSFRKIRSVANAIADDADLSYVRSTKFMENQKDILNVQEKRLEAQALEGAQALEALDTTDQSRRITHEIVNLRQVVNGLEGEAANLRAQGNVEAAIELETEIARKKESIQIREEKQRQMSIVNVSLDKAREGKKLSEEEVASLKQYTVTAENLNETDKRRILAAIEFNNEVVDGRTHFQNLQVAIDKSIEREEVLNKRMGVTSAIVDGFSKLPGFNAIFKSEDVEHVKNLAREAYVEQQRFAQQALADKEAILSIEEEIKRLENEKPEGYENQIEVLKVTRERHIVNKKVNEEAAQNVKLTSRSEIMGKILTKTLGNLGDVLTDPATIFTFLVTKGLQFNSEVVSLAKNLNVTETEATKIRNQFTSISANTMDTAINTERLLKAQSELNKELSLGVLFSGDTLVNFTRLTEKIGLSAQQAAKLTLASASTGESATEFAGKSALAAAQQAKTLGITVNMKEIMEDTANLTNEQLILFGRQPEAIGKTLAEVKKLGIELSDLNAISGKLLDFQGSIESELEAELLTGKQLNLERARAAALAGDQATLAKEIASQVGTIGEFEQMNVLQRQKMAEALGMNVDQLSGVLIRQEAINKGIAGAKDLTDEQLTAAKKLADSQGISMAEAVVQIQEQRDAQQKFNDAVQKLQRLFGELLGGPVGELLDAIVDVASVIIGPIAAGLNFILTPIKMFTEFLTRVPDLLKVAAAAMLLINFEGALGSFDKLKEKITKIPDIIPKIPPIIPGGGEIPTPPVIPGGPGPIPGAVTDQASGIIFDERMTGGGRFKDLDTGRMVSEKAANEAGVFKPYGTPEVPKPKDIDPTPDLDPVRKGGEDIVNIPQSPDDGSMLKEKMKNIAEGLKYFASMEVVKGGLALLIASPGLYVLSKAADGLNKLGEVKGEALQEAMKGIAEGVEKFGTVKVILGSIGLLVASPGLVLLGVSAGGIKKLADIEGGVVEEALGGLAEGVSKFGSAKVVLGAIGLTIASPGLVLMGVSAGGIKKISDIEGDVVKDTLSGLAKGVKKFGSAQVMLGAIGLTVASPGLVLLGLSSKGLKSLDDIKPKKIKEAMEGVADGVGKFATAKVALGAIGILLASPGLVILGAGSIGLKALESVKSEKVKEALGGIAKGVGKFSNPKVLLGSLGLIAVTPGILTLALASPGLALIGATGPAIAIGLKAVSKGIGAFGQNMVNILKGALALTALSVPIAAAAAAFSLLKGVDVGAMLGFTISLGLLGGAAALLGNLLPQILMGAIGLAAVGAAIIPAALAFSLLEGIDLGAMFGFVGALTLLGGVAALLGNIAPFMLAGAVGIAAVGLAIIPAAAAFSMLEGLDPTAMLGFAAALGILGITAAGLSLVGPAIIIGAAALTALSFALIPISKVLAIASPGIQVFNDAIKELDPSQLLGLGAALPVLALGLTFFGASIISIGIASIGLLILGKALKPIAEMAPKLDLANTAIKGMATSIALLATSLNTIDASALETLSNFEGNITLSTVNTTDQTTNTTDNTLSNLEQLTITANTVTLTGETISTVAATNTSEQVSAVTNTANTLDQTVATTNSLANLITKQNTATTTTVEPVTSKATPITTEIVPGISVVTPSTTTQKTLTTNTIDQASIATNTVDKASTTTNAVNTVDKASVATNTNTVDQTSVSTNALNTVDKASVATNTAIINIDQASIATNAVNTVDQTSASTNALNTVDKASVATNTATSTVDQASVSTNAVNTVDSNTKLITNELVPGISVTTPKPESTTVSTLEKILTLTTEEINTAIGLLNASQTDRSLNLDTLDVLKAQAAFVDLRDGKQDIPSERFSNDSLKIVESIITTVSELGTNTNFQQVGEQISGAEISGVEGPGFSKEKVNFFKAKEPESGASIKTPDDPKIEKTNNSQVFIDNLQPLIAETVTATVNALVPPMVAALKEGQGKVKVVNDNFNASGQKGDINTIRRLPSDNFA